MRQVFEEELQELHAHFFQMGKAVHEAIEKAVESFIKHDKELAQEVIAGDERINHFEADLEQKCIELIALQQPVSTDLRRIITVMKATSDLERMGDHAVSIAKSTIRVKGTKREFNIETGIADMSAMVLRNVRKTLDAYIITDAEAAKLYAKEDRKVDVIGKELYAQSIEFMRNDPEIVLGATDYIRVTSYLERIGDYATNISEWTVFLTTGKVVELNTQNHLNQ